MVAVMGVGAGGWRLTSPAGDNIIYNGVDTTTTGYITGKQYEFIQVRCVVANATWIVDNFMGPNIESNTGYNAGDVLVAQTSAPTDTTRLWYDTDETVGGILGNADLLNGYPSTQTSAANKIPVLDVNGKLPSAMIQPLTTADFVTPTLTAGWGVWDSGTIPTTNVGVDQWRFPRYVKDPFGRVQLMGLIKNTSGSNKAAGSAMFVLPAGFRPGHRIRFAAAYGTSTADAWLGVDVQVDGTVYTSQGSPVVPNGQWVSLSNVTFIAEQ